MEKLSSLTPRELFDSKGWSPSLSIMVLILKQFSKMWFTAGCTTQTRKSKSSALTFRHCSRKAGHFALSSLTLQPHYFVLTSKAEENWPKGNKRSTSPCLFKNAVKPLHQLRPHSTAWSNAFKTPESLWRIQRCSLNDQSGMRWAICEQFFNISISSFEVAQVMSTPDGAMSFVPDPKKVSTSKFHIHLQLTHFS